MLLFLSVNLDGVMIHVRAHFNTVFMGVGEFRHEIANFSSVSSRGTHRADMAWMTSASLFVFVFSLDERGNLTQHLPH